MAEQGSTRLKIPQGLIPIFCCVEGFERELRARARRFNAWRMIGSPLLMVLASLIPGIFLHSVSLITFGLIAGTLVYLELRQRRTNAVPQTHRIMASDTRWEELRGLHAFLVRWEMVAPAVRLLHEASAGDTHNAQMLMDLELGRRHVQARLVLMADSFDRTPLGRCDNHMALPGRCIFDVHGFRVLPAYGAYGCLPEQVQTFLIARVARFAEDLYWPVDLLTSAEVRALGMGQVAAPMLQEPDRESA